MPEQITLIQCTDTKRDESAPAKDLYDESLYFRKMRAYAEAKDCGYQILSAKHGLVPPDTVLEPYDAFGLEEQMAKAIAADLAQGSDIGVVEIVAGKSYTEHLTPELERRGFNVIDNFTGLEIGERMQKLEIRTRREQNHSLV